MSKLSQGPLTKCANCGHWHAEHTAAYLTDGVFVHGWFEGAPPRASGSVLLCPTALYTPLDTPDSEPKAVP